MSFGHPHWLWALAAIPLLALIFVYAERRSTARLRAFVSPRLLPQLGATVNRFRRALRFALLLLGLALAVVSLAQPRWGYSYEEVKRKGLDLILAVDTSRSMLANDVPPNRLQRVKLAAQDLVNELRGDRIGLVAFAGRAFLQAPLTIDYDAAVEALNDLDTSVIPEGGTNISEAINLAVRTFGKSAVGNRALIIFTDGEELAGDSAKVAKAAADAGVRIFTIGVGTPEGSLIPLPGQSGGTAFVKDSSGQVVKSKLDEKRLREIAQTTGGMFLPLANGPATMQQLYTEGLSQMQAGDIDARMSRQPIERYQWPLGAAILALLASVLISERKAPRRLQVNRAPKPAKVLAGAAVLLLSSSLAQAAAPGLEEYRNGQYKEAFERFQQTLEANPNTRAADKIQFDAGAAAYKMKDYAKALQSFSQALLSPDRDLQSRSHYNLGNTLYQRGETQKSNETKLTDWSNALQHYDQALKINPDNKEAQENSAFVKQKIEEVKKQQEQEPTPTPSPSPNQQKKDEKKEQQQDQKQQQQSGNSDQQQKEQGDPQSQDKGDGKEQQPQPGQSPSPSPTPGAQDQGQPNPTPSPGDSPGAGSTPTPSPGEQPGGASPSPSAGEGDQGASPSPSPGEGEGNEQGESSPTPAPSGSPGKKPSGPVKGAPQERPEQKADGEMAEAEQVPEGEMTEEQAERLLESMKDEEKRVQLDERRPVRRVYNDW